MSSGMYLRRLQKQLMAIKREPIDYVVVKPADTDITQWHYVFTGAKGSPYEGGHYHGEFKFPPEYPFKPPLVTMTTPNGRFACSTRLCFNLDEWNPCWTPSTMLMMLYSCMLSNELVLAGVTSSTAQKKKLAAESLEVNCRNPAFRKLFPELVELHERRKGQMALTNKQKRSAERVALQVSSSAGLDALTSGNSGALEEVRLTIAAAANARLSPDADGGGTENRCELDRLVSMAADLGDIVVRHTENENVREKELALQPFAQDYYTAVRSGICNAYVAACVVSSTWVCTSKTGRIGKAGKAVKLLSSIPVVGVLAGPVGTALKVGDGHVQTRRLEKISCLAPDAVECCSLARKLGLRLTDSLPDDAISAIDEADEVGVQVTAGMVGAAASGSSQGIGASSQDPSEADEQEGEDALLDYMMEKVAGREPTDNGGRKLGKEHVRKLLKAVRRDCLKGMTTTEQKVNKLLEVVVGGANMCPTGTSSVPEDPSVQLPAVAPSHDAGLGRDAMATVMAQLEALKLANAEQQAKLRAYELDKAQHKIEVNKLREKVASVEKSIPKLHVESGDSMDAGEGQLFKQKQQTKTRTKEELWRDAEISASAADRRLTPDEHQAETRNIRAHVHEVDNRVDVLEAQLAALRGKGKTIGH